MEPLFSPKDRTWLILKDTLLQQIDDLRDSLERADMTDKDTAFVRGKLALARDVLSLELPPELVSGR